MDKEKLLEILKKELFEDWRKTKIKKDGTYDEKLYTVSSNEFIKRCKEENLCKYEELEDGTFKAAIATLSYDSQPKYEEERKDDVALLELCLDGLSKEEIAIRLHEIWKQEHNDDISFDELTDKDKNYYYNQIDICFNIIKNYK